MSAEISQSTKEVESKEIMTPLEDSITSMPLEEGPIDLICIDILERLVCLDISTESDSKSTDPSISIKRDGPANAFDSLMIDGTCKPSQPNKESIASEASVSSKTTKDKFTKKSKSIEASLMDKNNSSQNPLSSSAVEALIQMIQILHAIKCNHKSCPMPNCTLTKELYYKHMQLCNSTKKCKKEPSCFKIKSYFNFLIVRCTDSCQCYVCFMLVRYKKRQSNIEPYKELMKTFELNCFNRISKPVPQNNFAPQFIIKIRNCQCQPLISVTLPLPLEVGNGTLIQESLSFLVKIKRNRYQIITFEPTDTFKITSHVFAGFNPNGYSDLTFCNTLTVNSSGELIEQESGKSWGKIIFANTRNKLAVDDETNTEDKELASSEEICNIVSNISVADIRLFYSHSKYCKAGAKCDISNCLEVKLGQTKHIKKGKKKAVNVCVSKEEETSATILIYITLFYDHIKQCVAGDMCGFPQCNQVRYVFKHWNLKCSYGNQCLICLFLKNMTQCLKPGEFKSLMQDFEEYEFELWSACSSANSNYDDKIKGYIKLKIKESTENDEIHFRVKETTAIWRLKKTYCERIKVPSNKIIFLYNGSEIEDVDTPLSIKINPGDFIFTKSVKPDDDIDDGYPLVKVIGDKEDSHCRIKETTALGKLLKLYCENVNVPLETIRLIYAGKVIKDEDTLLSLKINKGDCIEAKTISPEKKSDIPKSESPLTKSKSQPFVTITQDNPRSRNKRGAYAPKISGRQGAESCLEWLTDLVQLIKDQKDKFVARTILDLAKDLVQKKIKVNEFETRYKEETGLNLPDFVKDDLISHIKDLNKFKSGEFRKYYEKKKEELPVKNAFTYTGPEWPGFSKPS